MLTRPPGLPDSDLAAVLAERWDLSVDAVEYAPVGFGSHHWRVRTTADHWFVTVDDLDAKLIDRSDTREAARSRLSAALGTAHELNAAGCGFVVAPVLSSGGNVVEVIDARFVCALYPHVDGRVGTWGHYGDQGDRLAVVDILVALHRCSDAGVRTSAFADDFTIPCRQALVDVLTDAAAHSSAGPFGERARELVAQHAHSLQKLLARYDELVAAHRFRSSNLVVTHGEPHPGNVIIGEDGPRLIDWDTALLAPPERDLWELICEDATVRDHYAQQAGHDLDDDTLLLFRLRWDLCEIALYVEEFRRPHAITDDTNAAWANLVEHLDPARWVGPM